MPEGCSKRDFFWGDCEAEQERLAIIMECLNRVARHLCSECYQLRRHCVCRCDALTPRDRDRRDTEAYSEIEWQCQQDVVVSIMGLSNDLAMQSFSSRSTERDIHPGKTSPLV